MPKTNSRKNSTKTKRAKSGLTLKQEKFCRLYATDNNYFANGTQAYLEVFSTQKKKMTDNAAAVESCALLRNPKILARIDEFLSLDGFNSTDVDKQTNFLIQQNADFSNKLGAIREYNKLKGRITDKLDLTTKGEKLNTIEDGIKQILDKKS